MLCVQHISWRQTREKKTKKMTSEGQGEEMMMNEMIKNENEEKNILISNIIDDKNTNKIEEYIDSAPRGREDDMLEGTEIKTNNFEDNWSDSSSEVRNLRNLSLYL